MDTDERFIRRALSLARRGMGTVSPNPMVGAVIVREGEIAGEGCHMRAGGKHAEIAALEKAGKKARGSTLYLNLEPCSHRGRTPPCADAIINSGVSRVVACMRDPNPLVSGKGFRKLASAGVRVESGIFEGEAKLLNESYLKYITSGLPFVTVKAAMTLDGKIAARGGKPAWISSEASRRTVHRMRSVSDAVLVGRGTVKADDPMLTVRGVRGARQPYKVIVDTLGKTPLGANVFKESPGKVIIAAAAKTAKFDNSGAVVIAAGLRKGRVNLKVLMRKLGKLGISSVLIEGGGEIIASAFEEKIVDKVVFFYAPKIFGGRTAPTAVGGEGAGRPCEAPGISGLKVNRSGEDVVITGYPVYGGGG